MQKRIAIQLFGHLRTFNLTFELFKNNLLLPNERDGYILDIFIHTWDELDHQTVNYRNPNGTPLTDKKLLPEDILLANNLYSPKIILVEPQLACEELIIKEKIGSFNRSIKGCLNMSYTLFKSSELRNDYQKTTSVSYDWVIVTRPDILFITEFRIDDFLKAYKDFNFLIPKKGLFYANSPFGRGNKIEEPQFQTGSDLIYFAKPEIIDTATSLYEEFDKNININNFYCMESWWADFWRSKNLKPYPLNFRHGPDFDVVKTSQSALRFKNKVYFLDLSFYKHENQSKINYKLFNKITILSIKFYNNKTKYLLFGFITLYSIKQSHYLFGIFPILKIKK